MKATRHRPRLQKGMMAASLAKLAYEKQAVVPDLCMKPAH